MSTAESICPGCGLAMPARADLVYEGGFNASPECWAVFTEVLGKEFSNAVLFGQVHQLTVDAYAAQHAGGNHPDKSVVIHLCGLYLVLERGLRPTAVAPFFQRLAAEVQVWPHLEPPAAGGQRALSVTDSSAATIFNVALAQSVEEHIRLVREWAGLVWRGWSAHHAEIRQFATERLAPDQRLASQ